MGVEEGTKVAYASTVARLKCIGDASQAPQTTQTELQWRPCLIGLLNCYWVGSLDFNFLVEINVFSTKPHKKFKTFCKGVPAATKFRASKIFNPARFSTCYLCRLHVELPSAFGVQLDTLFVYLPAGALLLIFALPCFWQLLCMFLCLNVFVGLFLGGSC